MPSVEERFWAKVEKTDDCWLWTGVTLRGYGQFNSHHGKTVRAHRFAYEMLIGPIPEGLTIDHLCRVRNCVNPEHMEPVTRHENILRGFGQAGLNARKTHCKYGHEFTSDNTVMDYRGRRECRECRRRRDRVQKRARYHARKADLAAGDKQAGQTEAEDTSPRKGTVSSKL